MKELQEALTWPRLLNCLLLLLLFALSTGRAPLAAVSRVTLAPHSAPLRGSADWPASCGTAWQAPYAALHARIVSGAAPQRTLVSVAVEAGVADRLSGLVSQFLFALLSGRALQCATYGNLPPWEAAYVSPHLDMRPPALSAAVLEPLKFTYRGVRGYDGPREYAPDSGVDPARYYPLYLTNDYGLRARDMFHAQDLARAPEGHEGVPTILSASNRGKSYAVFDNPHHSAQLQAMGLTPDNAFACVHRFLFALGPRTCDDVCREHARILDAAGAADTLRIAIHVRSGDAAFAEGDVPAPWQQAEAHFSCAEEIAATRAAPNQSVLFYFNSDSLSLRRQAVERYGARLLTDLRAGAGQTDCAFHGGCDSVNASFRLAVAQLDLFARADVHVVSIGSGYGAMGAWLAPVRRHGQEGTRGHGTHIYRVLNGQARECGVAHADAARDVAFGWAGF
jgi:hypothetical protein